MNGKTKIVKEFEPTKNKGAQTKTFLSFEALKPLLNTAYYVKKGEKIVALEIDERGITAVFG